MSLRSSRITQDFAALKKMVRDGSIVELMPFDSKNKSIDHLAITFRGSKGTAYEGGLFKLEMKFPAEYPNLPPFVRLYTPIWHPNFWPKPNEYPGQRNICLALVDPGLAGKKEVGALQNSCDRCRIHYCHVKHSRAICKSHRCF